MNAEIDAGALSGRAMVPVRDLFVQCSLALGPGAVAASDCCGSDATSAVFEPTPDGEGRYLYRCALHAGILWRRWSMGTESTQKVPVLTSVPRRVTGDAGSNVDQMLADVTDRGRQYMILREGKPVAMMLPYEAYEELISGQG